MKKIYGIIQDDALFAKLEKEFMPDSITRLDNNIAISKNIKDISHGLANSEDKLFIITDVAIRDLYTIYMFNTLFFDTSRMHSVLITNDLLADDLLIGYEFGTLEIISKDFEEGTLNKVLSFVS